MSNHSKSMTANTSLHSKAKKVWQHYEDRRRKDEFEPSWIHSGYELVKRFLDGTQDEDDREAAIGIIESHDLPDGHVVNHLGLINRIIHDGWKVGTPTWIFMGRTFCTPQRIANGWIMISREVPEKIAEMVGQPKGTREWMAYHFDAQMGHSAMTANCIGPCRTADEVRRIARMESAHQQI